MPLPSRPTGRPLAVAAVALATALSAAGCGAGPAGTAGPAPGTGAKAAEKSGARAPETAEEKAPAAQRTPAPAGGTEAEWVDRFLASVEGTRKAHSVTVDAAMRGGGGGRKATVRMSSNRDKECRTTSSFGGPGTVEVLRTRDGSVYLRLNEARLRELGEADPERLASHIRTFAGRWMAGDPASAEIQQGLRLCDFRELVLASVPTRDQTGGIAAKAARTTVNGRAALRITTAKDGIGISVDFAAEGRPVLLRMEQKGGDGPFVMVFSGYGEPVRAAKPPAESIVTREAARRALGR
ncbi:hypothetical protein [Streptomyces sp. NPDC001985]|uniref:hypothetical protein n=1 Tax=Streptomyces sp. NPDC001985 TaxID=3154406 RepID=UPI00331C0603